MSNLSILGYFNTKPYPIAFTYKGCRVTLYNQGDCVKDREGNPVLDPALGGKDYSQLGLCAKYVDVKLPTVTPVPIVQPATPAVATVAQTPVEDVASKIVSAVESQETAKEVTEPVDPLDESRDLIPADQLTDERKARMSLREVVKEGNTWRFKLNNFTSTNPAGVKIHIRKAFGEDFLQTVKFSS